MYRLRAWEPADAERLLSAFAEPELARQAPQVPATREEALAWIDRCRELGEQGEALALAVVEGDGPPLGHVQVAVTSRRHGVGWVSYWTHAEARGRGAATAGARLAADLAFGELDLYRLELGHRLNNPGSCLVACRAGFRPEGIEREKLLHGGERFDTGTHARLAADPVEGVPETPCGT
ncbi:GNAT family N-acetyltransferase [Nocardiopsis algeriensis]|uniref:RimJ/RimL family protein N-acetyltransferase n=1 Tax=Nocardiopsis algeriensis TaxID=1478215 RepID=A0A841IUP6_9ACTN|nr:RimJ/RimL family protein N-acetyltransferase [Nocardiopsis algeriensis]